MRIATTIFLAASLIACGDSISDVECTSSDECVIEHACVSGQCRRVDAGIDANTNVDSDSDIGIIENDSSNLDSFPDGSTDVDSGGDSGFDLGSDVSSGDADSEIDVSNNDASEDVTITDPEGCTFVDDPVFPRWECRFEMGWYEAVDHCESAGLSLIAINSVEEQRDLFNSLYDSENAEEILTSWINPIDGGYSNWHPNITPATECVLMSTMTTIPQYPEARSCNSDSDCRSGLGCGVFGPDRVRPDCSCLPGLEGNNVCLPYEYGFWQTELCDSVATMFFCEST